MVLAQNYSFSSDTNQFATERTNKAAGRSIDAVRIEDSNDTLSLVLTEVKASDKRSPPQR